MLTARISATQPYCDNGTSLYEAIKNGDLSEVAKNLSLMSYDKHFFDENENSAAATAIKYGKEEIYEFLVSKGICLGPHERMDEIVGGKDTRIKKKLRDIHRQYFNTPNLNYLINLNVCSKLSHEASASDRREHLRLITEAFEDLNSLRIIAPILKVASTATNLKIVFDFKRDSVECLDPAKNRNIMATTYTDEAYIYVGAEGLIAKDELSKEENNDNRSQVLGVLIHELTHFVMQLVYVNDCKPYRNDDLLKLNEFNEIVEESEVIKGSEPFISSVYEYPLSKHHAELIVRVPHLTALYKDYEDKYIEVSSEFSRLFDFYDDNTLVDLNREYPLLEAKNEIREVNELCGTLATLKSSDIEMSQHALDSLDLSSNTADKILFISSNYPQMTMRAIFQQITDDQNFESSYIFADLKTIKTSKILNLVAKALKLCTKPTLIVDCGSRGKINEMKKVVKDLNEKHIDRKIVFVSAKNRESLNNFEHEEIEHFWNHLAINFQKKLLRKKIIFQGTEMKLEILVNDLSLISSIPFKELLANQKVAIGQKVSLENSDKLIERKFLPASSRKSRNSDQHDIEHKFVELLYFANKSRAILLSDEPGMGKSTSLKMLTLKLRKKYSSHWITFIDLKQHVEAFPVNGHVEFKNRKDIATFLSQKILKIQNFDDEVFSHLFNCDRVVVLLDGLDEICPSYKQFIFGLMSDIQRLSKNQLWITTRPHLVDEVEKKLRPFTIKLKPFTKANRRDFFEKHFSNNVNLDIKLEEVEIFFRKLCCNVSNPLILRIIVEILDEDQSLKLSEANLFSIYDRFTTKLVDKSLDKGSEAKKDIAKSFGNSNIVDFYQKIAFQTIFSDLNNEKFEALKFKNISKPPLHEIVRVGLIFTDGAGNFHFIHQTFAEFYVAKFFIEIIFNPLKFEGPNELNIIIDFFVDRVLNKFSSSFVRILIDSALETNVNVASWSISDNKLSINHFKTLVNDGCFKLIKIIALHLCPNSSKLLFMPLDYGDNLILVAVENQSLTFVRNFFALLSDINALQFVKMFFIRTKIDQNIFHFAIRNSHSKVFKYLVQSSKNIMSKKELAELLMHQNQKGQTVFHCSIYSKFDPKFIFEVVGGNLSELQLKALVETTTKDNRNSLHLLCMVTSKNFDVLLAFMQQALRCETLKKLMLQEDSYGCRAFDYALQNKNKLAYTSIKAFYLEIFSIKGMQKIVLPVDQSTFQLISGEKLQRLYFFMAELFKGGEKFILKNFFLTKNNDGATLLMFAVTNYDDKDFEAFCSLFKVFVSADRLEILGQTNTHNECAFHLAVKTKNRAFIEVGKLYRESFKEQKLREIILSCDKSWLVDLIHIHSGTLKRDSIIRKRIYHYLEDLFEGSEEIDKFKDFFLCSDEHGQTVFNIAASCENHEVFEDLFAFSRKILAIDVLKNMLFQKDEYGKVNLVDAIKSGSNSTFELVKNSYCQVFSLEEMQKMLTLIMDGRNIFSHSIIWSPQNELFRNLCKFLMEVFAYDEVGIKIFFTSFDRTDKTVLMYATKYENVSKNYFQILLSFIEKMFDEDTIKMLLLQKNKKGKTAFHFAIGNYFEENYKFVERFYLKTLDNAELKEMISTEVDWENFLNEKESGKNVEETKRLLAFLEIVFVDDKMKLKEFFLKRYRNGTTFNNLVKKKGRRHSNEVQEIISFLKQQLPDDEQIRKIIRDNSSR